MCVLRLVCQRCLCCPIWSAPVIHLSLCLANYAWRSVCALWYVQCWESDSESEKLYKYMLHNHQPPDTKSNHKPTSKQHAVVSIQLNMVTCPVYPEKFIRKNVITLFLLLSVVIVTLPPSLIWYYATSCGASRLDTVACAARFLTFANGCTRCQGRILCHQLPISVSQLRNICTAPPVSDGSRLKVDGIFVLFAW